MGERFSALRFVCIIVGLLFISVSAGSVFVSYKGSQTSTQSWLSLVSIIFSLMLVTLTPLTLRKL